MTSQLYLTTINLISNNFKATIAIATLLFCLVYIFFNLFLKNENFFKILGILIITYICLFADKESVYFITTIIFASTFIQQDFLEKVLAIIFKSNGYFNYKIRTLTNKEQEEKATKEIIENDSEILNSSVNTAIEKLKKDKDDIKTNEVSKISFNRQRIEKYLKIEKLALNYVEKIYNAPIKQNVKLYNKWTTFEFDGLLQTQEKNIIFEIKYIADGRIRFNGGGLQKYINKAIEYDTTSKNKTELQIIFVVPEMENEYQFLCGDKYTRFIEAETKDTGVSVSIKALTFADIEYNKLTEKV